MIDCDDFSIVVLESKDAESLSFMLLKNSNRFERFFPMTLSENQNIEMTREYIALKKSLIDKQEEYTLALKDASSGNIVGLIILKNIDKNIRSAEIAYCIDIDFGNKGWITKSVEAMVFMGFDELYLDSLYILAHQLNLPSIKVAKKSDFRWVKTVLNGHTPPNEEPLDMEYYLRTK